MKQSAGLLVFKRNGSAIEVLLEHPGGPFWSKKDSWTVPKGEPKKNEEPIATALREFQEETGFALRPEELIDLGLIKDDNGKTNYIWAAEAKLDITQFNCKSYFEIEWPPKSGQRQKFPEADKIDWFEIGRAKQKIFKSQVGFIDRLAEILDIDVRTPEQQSLL